ncbi:MAG: YqeG family HAD IIIA-type phosphatase [Clostridia bacterium]|nr:YqeG family HAD IIIA-type phosphatase [Clostridia bacterium]
MILYPDYYCQDVTKITPEFLNKHKIKGLILDVDNTLIDIDRKILEGAKQWHEEIVKAGFKTIILSNTNKIDKVESVAKVLNIEYISFARKPSRSGFTKAKEKLNLPAENIAVVGDQIFTDVIGANRSNMFAILVKPISKKDLLITKWKRPMEEWIIKKYLKSLEK